MNQQDIFIVDCDCFVLYEVFIMSFNSQKMFVFPIDKEPYIFENKFALENEFRDAKSNPQDLPKYNEIRAKLPEPVWNRHEDAIKCYYRTWEIAFSNLRNANEKSHFVSDYIDCAFFNFSFLWDSSFIVMFGKYAGHIFNFQKTLDNFYSHQHKDGYITRQLFESENGARFAKDDPASTGPNILPWSEWEYYSLTGDTERLKKIFAPLLAYHKWLQLNRTWQNGGYWSTGLACGMDNQPRVPREYSPLCSHGFMIWLDICAQQYLSGNILLKIAKIIDREQDALWLKEEQTMLLKLINEQMWDEKTAFYYDMLRDGTLSNVKSIGAYWTMLAGITPKERADRFVAHLDNEKEFKRPFRIPSLSADHPDYYEYGDYWRGSVWAPTNYMVLKALEKYDFNDLSYDIADNYLRNVVAVFNKDGTIYENYAPEYIERGSHSQAEFVGWTGLAPINIMFEYVFGIRPDAQNNKIVWYVNLLDEHGVKNYPIGNSFVDLICMARSDKFEKPNIVAHNYSNFTITLEVKYGKNSFEIKL